jgi:hypothetical protein
MPRNGFDSLAAVARLNTDDTSHHRERWPSLDWVWDELDMLRECWMTAIDPDDHDALETERNALSDERNALSDERNALYERDALSEQRDALSEAVRLLLEPEPDMERVQDILMGGWS